MMKIVTVNLKEESIERMNKLVEKGLYPSRSELIRASTRAFLLRELRILKNLKIQNEGPKYIRVPKVTIKEEYDFTDYILTNEHLPPEKPRRIKEIDPNKFECICGTITTKVRATFINITQDNEKKFCSGDCKLDYIRLLQEEAIFA